MHCTIVSSNFQTPVNNIADFAIVYLLTPHTHTPTPAHVGTYSSWCHDVIVVLYVPQVT